MSGRGGAPAGERFRRAIAAIDALNAEDPTQEGTGSKAVPAALAYGRRMSAWLMRLCPDASEPLRLAVRAQHIARWKIPRSDYPAGRAGYLRWRTDLAEFHAATAGRILADAGYGEDTIARVGRLLRKHGLKRDAEVQALEDAACLTFLESQFDAFSRRHPDAKVIDIVRKTLAKMSDSGRAQALRLAAGLPDDRRALIEAAMAEGDPPRA